jgi:CheY-like chemotaxis protein
MGGSISCESTEGQGSTFRVTARLGIPKDQTPEPEHGVELLADTTVLIVDDNATNRRILLEILRNWGMKPVTANSAAEAFQLLKKAAARGEPFGLVISDVNMPEADGFMLAKQIRSDPEVQQIPLIMLTSGGRAGDVARRQEFKIAGSLMKPVKQSELFDVIVGLNRSSRPRSTQRPAGVSSPPLVTRPLRILLAEDNLMNQKLATGVLSKFGHSVRIANDGAEAVEACRTEQFDVVLMDVQMPVMDGFAATAAIREFERDLGRSTPIVAMTAHALKGDRERCIEAGMDDYVSKPIRSKQLSAVLDAVTQ